MDTGLGFIIIGIIVFILLILIIRWVGAWMLRIDEVIHLLRSINANLKEIKASDKKE